MGTTLICAPYIASLVLVIDTATEAVRTIPCGVDGERKWYGIAAVGTTLFCAQCNASSALVIDCMHAYMTTTLAAAAAAVLSGCERERGSDRDAGVARRRHGRG